MSESFIFQVLAIVGGVLAVIGSINAYLLKDLTGKINMIHIDLVTTKTQFLGVSDKVIKNELIIETIAKEQERTRFRLHSLEDTQKNIFSVIKEYDERERENNRQT
jgi:hypothetical protein